jgi:hypothetical protein
MSPKDLSLRLVVYVLANVKLFKAQTQSFNLPKSNKFRLAFKKHAYYKDVSKCI